MKHVITTIRRGVTLVELLVAVALTVAMILATGLIFNSASTASGKAMANNQIMTRLNRLTSQLDADFANIQTDLPFAIVFEWDHSPSSNFTPNTLSVRQDRIVCFTTAGGEAEATEGTATDAASYARVLYAQSEEKFAKPGEQSFYPDTPDRRVLTRGYKLLAPTPTIVLAPRGSSTLADYYDYDPIDDSTRFSSTQIRGVGFWRNRTIGSLPAANMNYFDESKPVSLISRPSMKGILQVGDVQSGSTGQPRWEGLQRRYLLPDVSDFRVEIWLEGNGLAANRWFGTPADFGDVATVLGSSITRFAFFWNIADNPPNRTNYVYPASGLSSLDWIGPAGIKTLFQTANVWPKALRFTFTLYDTNRRHYPEGQTYSYIVELPQPVVQK